MTITTHLPADLPTRHNGIVREDNSHLDPITRDLFADLKLNRRLLIADDPTRPHTGEWARFTDGTMRRISHVWEWGNGPESIQTSDGGSFHVSIRSGVAVMSGGLHPGLSPDLFTLTDDTHGAWFWMWVKGIRRAHNGVDVRIPQRVWHVASLPN